MNTHKQKYEEAVESAHYDINTNERADRGEEDLLSVIQAMDKKFVLDSNSKLPANLNGRHAYILGQTLEAEEDFWLRREFKSGNENVFAFGVLSLRSRYYLQIQRMRKPVVQAILKRKGIIPSVKELQSELSSELSRAEETLRLIEVFRIGPQILTSELSDLLPQCEGAYCVSIFAARRCAALLLHNDSAALKHIVKNEWEKIYKNHPNVHGDMQVIQNALYFGANIVTKDEGIKTMASLAGLKWVNF